MCSLRRYQAEHQLRDTKHPRCAPPVDPSARNHHASVLAARNPNPQRRAVAGVTADAAHAQQNPYIVEGLLKCTGCPKYLDRDSNGALNILKAATAAANNEARPAYLQRASSVHKSDIYSVLAGTAIPFWYLVPGYAFGGRNHKGSHNSSRLWILSQDRYAGYRLPEVHWLDVMYQRRRIFVFRKFEPYRMQIL